MLSVNGWFIIDEPVAPDSEDSTNFIAVDLEIIARVPLEALVAAFGQKVFVLHVGKQRRRYGAFVEIASMNRDPDKIIRSLILLVKKLPKAARKVWDQAQIKDFNIGVQAGLSPRVHELLIKADTIQQVAEVGGRIVLTTYGAALVSKQGRPKRRKKTATNDNQL